MLLSALPVLQARVEAAQPASPTPLNLRECVDVTQTSIRVVQLVSLVILSVMTALQELMLTALLVRPMPTRFKL